MEKVIYCMWNTSTGRAYIGMSANPQNRFKQHLSALTSNRHKNSLMQDDFNIFGNTFEFVILERGVHCRNHAELRWILRFKSYDKEFGYNYKDPSVITRRGTYSKALSEIMNDKQKNTRFSIETKKDLSRLEHLIQKELKRSGVLKENVDPNRVFASVRIGVENMEHYKVDKLLE